MVGFRTYGIIIFTGLILALFPILSAGEYMNNAGNCPPGFVDLNDPDYQSKETYTPFDKLPADMCLQHEMYLMEWEEAVRYCRAIGADLMTALTEEEMISIQHFLASVNGSSERLLAVYYDNWMGATDRFEDARWRWIVDEEFVLFDGHPTFWDRNEPEGRGNCLTMLAGDVRLHNIAHDKDVNRWKANDCYVERPFACQIRY